MDMISVDVTGLDVSPGDEVVLLGRQGDERLDVREVAATIGAIPWELLCRLGARIEREYSAAILNIGHVKLHEAQAFRNSHSNDRAERTPKASLQSGQGLRRAKQACAVPATRRGAVVRRVRVHERRIPDAALAWLCGDAHGRPRDIEHDLPDTSVATASLDASTPARGRRVLVRCSSATSVGANLEEALGRSSKADFASKVAIAAKEAREAALLARAAADGKTTKLASLPEANEVAAI